MTKVANILIAVILSANLCALTASAQEGVTLTPPSPEKQKLLNEFFDASGMNYSIETNFNNAMIVLKGSMLKNIYLKLSTDKSLTKKECREQAKAILKKVMDNFYNRLDYKAEMRKILSSVWGKHFSEDDLKKMVAFSKTEASKKFTANTPKMTIEGKRELKKRLDPIIAEKMQERLSKMRAVEGESSTK